MPHRNNITTFDWLSSFVTFHPQAQELSDLRIRFFNWVEETALTNSYRKDTGIIGAAWLVIFLSRNSYIDINLQEYIEDVDDCIYRHAINVLSTRDNVHEMLDIIDYYQNRFSVDCTLPLYRFTPLNWCFTQLVMQTVPFLQNSDTNLTLKVDILFKISCLIGRHIDEKMLQKYFYLELEGSIDYFKRINFEETNEIEENLINLVKLAICAKQYGNTYWVNELSAIISIAPIHRVSISNKYLECLFYIFMNYPNVSIHLLKGNSLINTNTGKRILFELITNLKQFDLSNSSELLNSSN